MGITLDEIINTKGAGAVDSETLRVHLSDESLAALEDITVSATDFDIRDLVNTQDSVAIGDETTLVDMATMDSAFSATSAGFPIMGIRQDAGGSPVSATGDAHPMVFNNDGELKVAADLTSDTPDDAVDAGNPIKVGGQSQGGLLAALSASGDRYHMLGDLYRRQWVNNAYNVAHEVTTETIGATASEIVAVPMPGRKNMTIQNRSNNSIWLGSAGTVTADNTATGGLEIPKQSSYTDDFGENLNIFLISDGAGRIVKVHQKG